MLDDKPIARISSARGKRHLRLMAARPGLPLLHIAPARWMLHEPPAPAAGPPAYGPRARHGAIRLGMHQRIEFTSGFRSVCR